MAKKMFVFDFDETLYCHANRCVPASARQALQQLLALGEFVVIATGRAPDSYEFICRTLGIPLEWVIALNGQLIYHNGEIVYEKFITLPSIREIYDIARENGFASGGFYQDGSLVSQINQRVQTVWTEFGSPLPKEIPDFLDRYALYQAHLYVTKEEANRFFANQIQDYIVNWSHETLMNLISKETGKSKGIEWLMQRFVIDRKDTYAFGDGFNDVDMIQSVAHGVAMGNASQDLKKVAEYVTDPPDGDGILHALQYFGVLPQSKQKNKG
ncbi:MAG TPA: HAD family hydrolase [Clostridia bacterium]|nr:HAD family hydrolase [Clostridia bacterium]